MKLMGTLIGIVNEAASLLGLRNIIFQGVARSVPLCYLRKIESEVAKRLIILMFKNTAAKGLNKQKPRVGVAYISKPRFDKIPSVGRSNSQLNSGNKSVSIVSLSPNNDLNYGKDMVLYNPYNKSISKQKIHLPYLKSRRAAPKIRKDPKQVRPRNESSIKNTSIDVLTSSHKNYNNKSLKNDKSFDLLREIKNLKKRISKPKVEDFDQSYRVGKR